MKRYQKFIFRSLSIPALSFRLSKKFLDGFLGRRSYFLFIFIHQCCDIFSIISDFEENKIPPKNNFVYRNSSFIATALLSPRGGRIP